MLADLATQPQRAQVEEVAYHLMRSQGTAYALFLQRIIYETSTRPIADKLPMAIGINEAGYIRMRVHWPTFNPLALEVKCELVKHALLKIIMGHFSSRRQKAIDKYGEDIYGMASDIVCNNFVDCNILKSGGFLPITAELYGIPKDETTEYYCEMLMDNRKRGQKLTAELKEIRKAYRNTTLDISLGKEPDRAEGVDIPIQPMEHPGPFCAVDMGDIPPELTDMTVEKALTDVRNEVEHIASGSDGHCGRGWDSREAKEFIEQVRRPPQIAWSSYLRALESRYRSEQRVISPLRPSRRNPDAFGRMKTFSLHVTVGIDVSGSMGTKQLEVIEPELRGMYNRGAAITLIQVDAAIQKKTLYRPGHSLMEVNGRGGTDFSPFLMDLRNYKGADRPGFAVFYTDGYGYLSGYLETLKSEMGKAKYDELIKRGGTRTPDGLELLWLLAEGTTSPEDFRRSVAPFGRIAVLPAAKRKKGGTEE